MLYWQDNSMEQNMKILIQNNKSQQEIVGFMIIVLMVVIAGVIFLGIYLRQDSPIEKKDAEINNFLSSSRRYTSECYMNNEPNYRSMEDLMVDCYNRDNRIICPNSKTSCFVLNETYDWMMRKLWPSGKDRPIKYVKMSFFYEQNATAEREKAFWSIVQGNKSGCLIPRAGSNSISMDNGNIVAELELCTGN